MNENKGPSSSPAPEAPGTSRRQALWKGLVGLAVAGVLLAALLHFSATPAPERRPLPDLSAVAQSPLLGPRAPLPSETAGAPRPQRRAALGNLVLHTVVPDHVGLTTAPLPSLFWHVSEVPPAGSLAHLVLEDVVTEERLVDIDLPPVEQPGLQRIDLWRYGHELPEFRSCRWSIRLRVGDAPEPPPLEADAWIRRVNLPAGVVEQLRAAPTDDFPEVYADAGLWYDALTLLVNHTEVDAANDRAWTELRSLLEQAQLVLL